MLERFPDHDYYVGLNHAFPESALDIRRALASHLEPSRFVGWNVCKPAHGEGRDNTWRRGVSEEIRLAAINSVAADFCHVSSLFEGLVDDAITSVPAAGRTPSAVTLFDLIPLLHEEIYLRDPVARHWYFDKVHSLKNAELMFAISESTRQEAIEHLGVDPDRVVNISAAIDDHFKKLPMSAEWELALRQKYGIEKPFVMYTGGIDHRKNIDGLIRSFAQLPQQVRDRHQLAVVCSASSESITELQGVARKAGLNDGQLVMTGYVSDDDLVALYNCCALFVFPSWHEGFGLPALEAMACGAPVIASNNSSLPEVVGREDALFNPRSCHDMSRVMAKALMDSGYSDSLRAHGLVQATKFSWEASADKAMHGIERWHEARRPRSVRMTVDSAKPTLAYVSPYPPDASGIADYSRMMLGELVNRYDVTLVVPDGHEVVATSVPECSVASVSWFDQHAGMFDQIVFHVGNSPFHSHMFELLKRHHGVVVLHDFYLGHIARHLEMSEGVEVFWRHALYESHGYRALIDLKESAGTESVAEKYPCNWNILRHADGVVVHSKYAKELFLKWYGAEAAKSVEVVPLALRPATAVDRAASRSALGLAGEVVVASFGIIAPIKSGAELIRAWAESSSSKEPNAKLVFVGSPISPVYRKELEALAASLGLSAAQVIFTGRVPRETYVHWLNASDIGVQLRVDSRGESSAAALDCLGHGLPLIVNAHGSAAELDQCAVKMLAEKVSVSELAEAIDQLAVDREMRYRMTTAGLAWASETLAPGLVADMYQSAFTRFAEASTFRRRREVVGQIMDVDHGVPTASGDWVAVSKAVASTFKPAATQRQFLVDVTVLALTDAKSGIQRVVRSVLVNLLTRAVDGFRVEPVYADGTGVYRYARKFTAEFLQLGLPPAEDQEIFCHEGDVFLGLDLVAHLVPNMEAYFEKLRLDGVKIEFVVYDLLPALQPHWFAEDLAGHLRRWYEVIGRVSDRILTISQAVAHEYMQWLDSVQVKRGSPLEIGHFCLGSDLGGSVPTTGVSESVDRLLHDIKGRLAFLMVGTIEPRKGHQQAIEAFEILWREGRDAWLVMVGREGWRIGALASDIRNHPEYGRRLHWLESATDEELDKLYARSGLLLAASLGEGFGLPLVEAARHGLPVLARDIPVFREVAGDGALYFKNGGAADLASALVDAIERAASDGLVSPESITRLTWEESTRHLVNAALSHRAPYHWRAGERWVFDAASPCLHSTVDGSRGTALTTRGRSGFLVFGPYAKLNRGVYRIRLIGTASRRSKAWVDVVSNAGEFVHLRIQLAERPAVCENDAVFDTQVTLPADTVDLEVRLWVDEAAVIRFERMEICSQADAG